MARDYDRSMRLTVRATYRDGAKAEQCTAANMYNAVTMLLEDLDSIHLVRPSRHSIDVVGRGVIEFWWDSRFHSVRISVVLDEMRDIDQ